jgi:hypothetical protein
LRPVAAIRNEYHQGKLNYRLRLTYASVKSLKSGTK